MTNQFSPAIAGNSICNGSLEGRAQTEVGSESAEMLRRTDRTSEGMPSRNQARPVATSSQLVAGNQLCSGGGLQSRPSSKGWQQPKNSDRQPHGLKSDKLESRAPELVSARCSRSDARSTAIFLKGGDALCPRDADNAVKSISARAKVTCTALPRSNPEAGRTS